MNNPKDTFVGEILSADLEKDIISIECNEPISVRGGKCILVMVDTLIEQAEILDFIDRIKTR